MRSAMLRAINLLALMVAVAWLARTPSWEPLLATLTCLAILVGQEIAATRNLPVNPDIALFEEFLRLLPSSGCISFIKDYDFHGPFRLDNLKPLFTFLYSWDKPEREFRDRGLDRKRRELLRAADSFLQLVGHHTSPQTEHINSLSPTLQRDQPEEYTRIGNEINSAADKVVKCHINIVRASRKKLHL
jgi:hypothetical protein